LSSPLWHEFGAYAYRIAEIETRLRAVVWCTEPDRLPLPAR